MILLNLLNNYGILFFVTVGIVLCIGLQVVDFINYISGYDNE